MALILPRRKLWAPKSGLVPSPSGDQVFSRLRAIQGGKPPGGAAPAPAPTLPAQANIGLWTTAQDLTTLDLDGSNKVSQWRDKSGNGRHWNQATAVNQPVYTANAMNGGTKPGLLLDKTAPSFMTLASALSLASGYSVYMVFRPTETKRHFLLNNSSGSANCVMSIYGDLDLLQDNDDTDFFNGEGDSPLDVDHSWVATCAGAANTGQHYQDFVALASGGTSGAGAMGSSFDQFGRRANGAFGPTWDAAGYIGEYVVWPGYTLDAGELTQLAAYSVYYWGI